MRALLMASAVCMIVTTILTAVALPWAASRHREPISWSVAACLFLIGGGLGLTVAFNVSWWATS